MPSPAQRNRRRNWLRPSVGVCAFAVLLLSVLAALAFANRDLRFAAEAWQVPGSAAEGLFLRSARRRMLPDLVARALPGRSREDVLAMLGEPASHRCPRPDELAYEIGRTGLFGADSDWLHITFDGRGRFVSWKVVPD